MSDEVSRIVDEADEVIASIKPLLAGRGPALQGAVLIELVAIYLAGHAPTIRREALVIFMENVLAMTACLNGERKMEDNDDGVRN